MLSEAFVMINEPLLFAFYSFLEPHLPLLALFVLGGRLMILWISKVSKMLGGQDYDMVLYTLFFL